MVTPYTGVWIETMISDSKGWLAKVTPYTGVWIETKLNLATILL